MESLTSLSLSADRRTFCKALAVSPLAWMSGAALAADANPITAVGRGKSLIVLWLDGGPSQLETFDPHPNSEIGGPTQAIETTLAGVRLAAEFPRLAREMKSVCLVRSLVNKEGDHERARHAMKTGARINPSVAYPCLGSVAAAEIIGPAAKLPRYITVLGDDAQSRAGYLGDEFDPFKIGDPFDPVPDLASKAPSDRVKRRRDASLFLEAGLALKNPSLAARTGHESRTRQAMEMMSAAERKAFAVMEEPASVRSLYGETPFGRGCLAARRLVQVGVRCVEVRLGGWDTHAKNFDLTRNLARILDPALAGLIADLRSQGMLENTLVACMGEFGRTPAINPLAGRDHWNTGYSAVLAGSGLAAGLVHGRTLSNGRPDVHDRVDSADLFATLLTALGIDPKKEYTTRDGRPIKLSDGKPVGSLLS